MNDHLNGHNKANEDTHERVREVDFPHGAGKVFENVFEKAQKGDEEKVQEKDLKDVWEELEKEVEGRCRRKASYIGGSGDH